MIYSLKISDEIKQRVHILDATKGKIYLCDRCGDYVIPIQGEKMPWHYRHKSNSSCTIGDRGERGCIIKTIYNNGYCGGSEECEEECELKTAIWTYMLDTIANQYQNAVSNLKKIAIYSREILKKINSKKST